MIGRPGAARESDASGLTGLSNFSGVLIFGGAGNLIGGAVPGARNLIANNTASGVTIASGTASANTVQGNWIGLDASGSNSVGSQDLGIGVNGGNMVTIADNVISGHSTNAGILLSSAAVSTTVRGNIIGLDASGQVAIGNSDGIRMDGAVGTVIGGPVPQDANLIAGNSDGIRFPFGIISLFVHDSTDTPLALPDVTTTISSTTVPPAGLLDGIRISLNIDHTYDGDLSITLIHPDGTRVLLVDRRGANGANFVNTEFSDLAGTPIAAGSAPFTGSWLPEQMLARLRGRPIAGNWTLEVVNAASGDTGILQSWSMEFDAAVDFQTSIVGNRIENNSSSGISGIGSGSVVDSNAICGNGTGVWSSGPATQISGNEIGYCAGQPNPNVDGIRVSGSGNLIAGNIVSHNSGVGVIIEAGRNNTITSNSIDNNGGLGIDLGASGPDVNDSQDGDEGANGLQNTPVLLAAAPVMTTDTQITGYLNSRPLATFQIEIFGNSSFDASGSGEGGAPLWVDSVTTDSNGEVFFVWTVPARAAYWSATATDNADNTSEFSAVASVPGEASPAGDMTVDKAGAFLDVSYDAACGATDHALFWGTSPIIGAPAWTGNACGFGVSGTLQFALADPAPGQFTYFVVVGNSGSSEGSYGRDSAGVERPESVGLGSCDPPQTLVGICP